MTFKKVLEGCIRVNTMVEEVGVAIPLMLWVLMKVLSAVTWSAGAVGTVSASKAAQYDFMPAIAPVQ
jgi:hypothetical protein